jgi:hypothetical protein
MSAARRTLAAGAALAALLALAACEIPLPTPSVTPSVEQPGALLEPQSTAIIRDTLNHLASADAARDPALLAPRVGGDAAVVRDAEYAIAKAGGDDPDALPSSLLAVYGPAATDWPRSLVAISSAPDETLTPVIMWWVQDDPRTPYQMREWAHMLPGAVVPAMPNQSIGDDELSLDAEGFSMTPREAIKAYADLLSDGEPEEATFAPDTYRERMFASRKALAASAKKRKGTYKDTIEARADEAVVLLTAEGSALVLVPITVTSAFTVPGAQLSLPKSDKALLSGRLSDRVVHHYRDFVVLNVPKDATLLPTVVAADHHLVDVTLKVKS